VILTLTRPLVWTSAILSDRYWSEVVGRHGLRALKAPKFIRCLTQTVWPGTEVRSYSTRCLPIEQEPVELEQNYQWLATRFQQRVIHWNTLRPWYAAEYRKWNGTPWSWVKSRQTIDQFTHAYIRRDIFKCDEAIKKLRWYEANYNQAVQYDRLEPEIWLCYAIFILMQLSMPSVDSDITRKGREWIQGSFDESFCAPVQECYPSKQCECLDKLDFWDDSKKCFRWTREDLVQEQKVKARRREPKKWFPILFSVLSKGLEKSPVPQVWAEAVWKQFDSLRNEFIYTPPVYKYFSWCFRVPRYEPQNWVTGQLIGHPASLKLHNYTARITSTHRVLTPPTSPDLSTLTLAKRAFASEITSGQDTSTSNYWTIGEIADHRTVDDAWVIESDGRNGYDVYDISSESPWNEVYWQGIYSSA
jgi:hypothetical protein